MKRLLGVRWLLAPLLVGSFISVSIIRAADNDGKTLFENRCSLCHPTSRPLGVTKSAEQWRQTVTKMKDYAGGRISDEEAETIINYLTKIRGK